MTQNDTALADYAAAISQMSSQLASGLSEAATRYADRVATEGGELVVSATRKFELLAAELGSEFRAAANRAAAAANAARQAGNEALAARHDKIAGRHYEQADRLLNKLMDSKSALDSIAADARAAAASADNALGGLIGKRIGPAFDAFQMLMGAADLARDMSNGDKLGGASTGVLLSWILGSLGAAIGVSVLGLPAVGVAVLAGIGALAGSFLGDSVFGFIRDFMNDRFSGAKNWLPTIDPLMLDLDGDGLELRSASGAILFDHDADGIRTGTGWIGSDDGILVRDINGNGRIDSGRELFGVNTIKSNGENATNGFDALADLDTNGDGSFTAADLAWNQVKVWRDINQDGVSDANELFSLDQLGISRIGVVGSTTNATGGQQAGTTINGNLIAQSASFTRDGEDRAVGSVNLSAGAVDLGGNNFHREFTDYIPPTPTALALPKMRGSGMVRDLSEAVSLDDDVARALTSFATAPTREAQREQLDDLITEWAKSSTFWSSLEESLQGTIEILGLPDDMTEQDYRKLISVLEAFNGERFYRVADSTHPATAGMTMTPGGGGGAGSVGGPKFKLRPPAAQLAMLRESYEALRESVYAALVTQTRLKPYLDSIQVVATADGGIALSGEALASKLENYRLIDPRGALIDLIELNRFAQQSLQTAHFDGLGTLRTWIGAIPIGSTLWAELVLMSVSAGPATAGTAAGDLYLGDSSNNTFNAGAGDDLLDGGAGNDTLSGGAGDDIYIGGAGNDMLTDTSSTSADVYRFGRGDGSDVITDSGGVDRIQFGAGITAADVKVIVTVDIWGNSLTLILNTGEQLKVYNMFTTSGAVSTSAIETVRFEDGTEWNIDRLKLEALKGTAGADTLTGTSSNDTLDGGAGNDTLSGTGGDDIYIGGAGNDTLTDNSTTSADVYRFGRGDGADVITDLGGVDRIELGAGITEADVKVRVSVDTWGNNLTLILSTGEQLKIYNMFTSGGVLSANALEVVRFADGTEWNIDRLKLESLRGTAGADALTGNSDDNIYAGGAGNDTLTDTNTTSADVYRFGRGDGADVITDSGGVDRIELGAGITEADVKVRVSVDTWGNNLTLILSTGEQLKIYNMFTSGGVLSANVIEVVRFADGTEWNIDRLKLESLRGTSGADALTGNSDDNIYAGGAGNDTLTDTSTTSADVYRFGRGDGSDVITDSGGVDRIELGAGITEADVTVRVTVDTWGNNLTLILNTGEQLKVYNMFTSGGALSTNAIEVVRFADGTEWNIDRLKLESLKGTAGADALTGTGGNDTLDGGAGNDTLTGLGGDDIYIGGAGNDTLTDSSSTSADVYRFGRGDGSDVITDSGGVDRIELGAGITEADVTVRVTVDTWGNNLTLILNTGEQLKVYNMFTSGGALSTNAVEIVRFADGTEWSIERLKLESLKGTAGADTLTGTSGNDTLDGGAGNDTLAGTAGDDIYIGGAGNDTLTDTSTTSADVYRFGRGDGADVITDSGGVDRIELGAGITEADVTVRVTVDTWGNNLTLVLNTGEQLKIYNMFTSGGALSTNAIEVVRFADGTEWNIDRLKLESLKGTAGADALTGSGGSDTLDGGAGNDTLSGLGGDDVYIGGAGNDTLTDTSTTSADVYRFGRGDGSDVITDSGGVDRIELGAGITEADVTVRVTVDTWGNNLTLILNTGEQLKVYGMFTSSGASTVQAVETVRFADGTEWNIDRLKLESLKGTAGNDTLTGTAGNDTLDGGAGNDTLSGTGGDDIYIGGAGNDTLTDNSTTSADVYRFGRGGAADVIADSGGIDRIELGASIVEADVKVRVTVDTWGNNLTLILNTGEQLKIYSMFTTGGVLSANAIEVVRFADGTEWNIDRLKLESLKSTAGADALTGTGGSDTLDGGAGNDTLSGLGGDDIYIGGEGNDTLTDTSATSADVYRFGRGDGSDVITDSGGVDRIELGAGITEADVKVRVTVDTWGNNLTLILNTGEQLKVYNMFTSAGVLSANAIEIVRFADGTEWNIDRLKLEALKSTTGADTLTGTSGSDTLDGGAGNDTLSGLGGDDIYVGGAGNDSLTDSSSTSADVYRFGRGDGSDVITDAGGVDRIELGAGITEADVTVRVTVDTWGNNLTLILNTGEQLKVYNMFSSGGAVSTNAVEVVRFADGTEWNIDRLKLEALNGTAGVDTLTGSSGSDMLDGGAGNDTLSGLGGDDTYIGGAGNDTLTDTSTTSADVYRFGRGDGSDVITDSGGIDRIELGDGITEADVKVRVSVDTWGNNLTLILNTGEQLKVYNMFTSSGALSTNAMEVVRFADGTEWNIDRLKLEALKGTAGADTLTGSSDADIYAGGAGNDTLTDTSTTSADVYRFGRGDGLDLITDSGGIDRIELGAGITEADVTVRVTVDTWGNNLTLILNTGEQLKVYNMFTSGGAVSTKAVEGVRFADGTEWDIARLKLEAVKGTTGADTLTGGSDDDIYTGGAGNDTMTDAGTTSSDVYRFGRGDGSDMITDSGGADRIELGAGITEADVKVRVTVDTWGNNLTLILNTGEQLKVYNMFTSSGAVGTKAIETVRFADGTEWDIERLKLEAVKGTAGADALVGTSANDTLDGGAGNDTLNGYTGNDTYVFGRGSERDTVVDNDATAGNTDIAQFGADVSADQLWFTKSGNDLKVSIIGTSDQLTISNWYAGNSYHVEQFKTSDGKVLLDSQVQNLVSAMASFSPPAAGQTTLPANYQGSLNTVIAANWH
jgi:Ca2+-binding RTX toxin-like protein